MVVAGVMRLGQRRNQRGGRGKQRRVAVVNRFAAKRDRKMRFARAGLVVDDHCRCNCKQFERMRNSPASFQGG
jgi:hypothetical protein